MNVFQAASAFKLWTNKDMPIDVVKRIVFDESPRARRPAQRPYGTSMTTPLRHLRWYIAGLLFVATVINYLDRQVFGILAPGLQKDMGWSELDYGRMVVAFQIAYAVMMMVSGRLLDRIGTRLGYALSVLVWSIAEIAHAFARSALGFGVARFFLGTAEAGIFRSR